MYDIVTFEPGDRLVMKAVNALIQDSASVIRSPNEGYRFILPGSSQIYTEGNGGEGQYILVLVGHGDVNGLSGIRTWNDYKNEFPPEAFNTYYKTIYIVACDTAAEEGGYYFVYTNWAQTVKKAYPTATVWASSTPVNATTLEGDWQRVGTPVRASSTPVNATTLEEDCQRFNPLVPINTLNVIAQKYYNQSYANSLRMADVRSLFKYHEVPTLKAANDKAPGPEDIMDVLGKAKQMPAATSIAAVPSDVTQNDLQNLQDISLLDTYVSVNSSAYLYKNHPKPYDITKPDEAAQFTKDLANARFLVITKGLPGLLIAGESSQQSFEKTTTAADLHVEFINQIFGSFGFSPSSLKQLDGIMTNIIKNLGALKLGWADQSETLDHLISTYFFEEVQGLGVKVPKIRLFYLHIDQSSWKASVGKSSVERFKFNMNYVDYTFTMSLATMPDMREPIKAYIKDMTKKNLEDIQKLVAMDAITKD